MTLEDEHADTHPTPDEHLAGREAAERVERGLRSLPVAQRAALELKSLGHSLQEIGEALETTANNAGVLVHRARQTLAAFLERGETS